MAPSFLSYETQEVINVSQDAHSSSPAPATGQIDANGSIDRVEDSMKAIMNAPRKVTDQPPQISDDEDDLYNVTPRAKISHRPQQPPGQESKLPPKPRPPKQAKGALASTSTAIPLRRKDRSSIDSATATDSLPIQPPGKASARQPAGPVGSKAPPSHATKDRSALPKASKASADGVRNGTGSHSKPQPRSRPKATAATPSQPQSTIKKNPAASSLAKLRAKRNAQTASDAATVANRKPGELTALQRSTGPGEITPAPTSTRARDEDAEPAHLAPLQVESERTVKGHASSAKSTTRKEAQTKPAKPRTTEPVTALEDTKFPRGLKNQMKRSAPEPPPEHTEDDSIYDHPGSSHSPENPKLRKKARTNVTSQAKAPRPSKSTQQTRKPALKPASEPTTNPTAPVTVAAENKAQNGTSKSGVPNARNETSRTLKRKRETVQNGVPNGTESTDTLSGDSKQLNGVTNDRKSGSIRQQVSKSKNKNFGGRQEISAEYGDRSSAQPNACAYAKPKADGRMNDCQPQAKTSRKDEVTVPNGHSGPLEQAPGDSQQNAICISDPPSSSPEPSPQVGERQSEGLIPNKAEQAPGGLPQTPSMYRSSPPILHSTRVPNSRLSRSSVGRKAAIISFSKNGPLNQGHLSRSRERLVLGSVSTNRTSMRSAARPSGTTNARNAYPRSSIPPKDSKLTKTDQVRSSHVSDNVEDALAAFRRKRKTKPEALENDVEIPPESDTNANGFPCSVHPDNDDDGFIPIDDYDEPVSHEKSPVLPVDLSEQSKPERTKSQIAMPPPTLKPQPQPRLRKEQRPEPVHSVRSAKVDRQSAAGSARSSPSQKKATSKRARDEHSEITLSTKRPCTQSVIKNLRAQASDTAALTDQDHSPDHLDQTIEPKKAIERQSVQPPSRKPGRIPSCNSQTVDVAGSPVPPGMTVPKMSTVLETFSQQAHLYPEETLEWPSKIQKHLWSTAAGVSTENNLAHLSYQQSTLPISRQQQPAEPSVDSEAATGSGQAVGQRLLVANNRGPSSANPFRGSQANLTHPTGTPGHSTFIDQLKALSKQTRSAGSPIQAKKAEKAPARSAQAVPVVAPKADPPSSSSSSPTSAESDSSDGHQLVLATWRNALRPHQMNLFDELVIVSHRLVRHLVDSETAAMGTIEDYLRRGNDLVELMESNHTKQREKYAETLKKQRRHLKRELERCEKEVRECAAGVKGAMYGSERDRDESNAAGKALENVLAKYC